jgi:TolB-like protein/Flp pilus assembly protein TadD
MKRCPECRRDYYDDTLSFCLDDGAPLVYGMSSENVMAERTEMLPTISDHLPSSLLDRFTTSRRSSGRKRAAVLTVLIAVVSAAIFFGYRYITRNGDRINSVAVMPLRPLNDDENAKALGLGLTDALITKLGSLRQVVVRPTSAITSFPAANESTEIGRRLSVDAVLEGTIQEADGRLRVNARLIRTSTGEQIWAEKFEQPATNLFAIQDALSSSIAKALAFELSKSDSDQLVRRGTNNSDAYEKYLRGRFYQTQNTADGLNRSIEFYEQAIALDASFAEAHAGIADANLILFNLGIRSAEETIPNARQALNRALQLNSDLSSTHTSLALIQFLIDKNWPEAEKSLQRAIALNPNNADAFLRYGYFLINVGRFDEAIEKLNKARELNPLSPLVNTNIGMAYMFSRRYPEAVEQLERTAAENPQFSLAQWLLGLALEESGNGERAFVENLKALEVDGGVAFAAELRKVKEGQGLEAANHLWFTETANTKRSGSTAIEKQKEPVRLTAVLVALRAATVKDSEQTLYWLERSAEEGDPTLFQIKYLTKFDFVRDDKRFQAIVGKLNF